MDFKPVRSALNEVAAGVRRNWMKPEVFDWNGVKIFTGECNAPRIKTLLSGRKQLGRGGGTEECLALHVSPSRSPSLTLFSCLLFDIVLLKN